jgi:hypothetical protein
MWGIIVRFWENEFIHTHTHIHTSIKEWRFKIECVPGVKWRNKDTLNGDSWTITDMSLKCKLSKE